MTVKRMLVFYGLLVVFLCACTIHSPKFPTKRMVRRCTPVLEEILRIQDLREELNTEVSSHIIEYKAGNGDPNEHREYIDTWLKHENALRSYVTRLYNEAYTSGCL